MPTPNPGNFDELHGVAAVSSCQAWAVGDYSGGTLVEHWNGTAWQQQPSPSPGSAGNGLFGAAATSATDAWAVGSYSSTGDPTPQNLIEHWNGTAWMQVPSPNPTANDGLNAVAATSTTDAWAVGEYVAGGVTHTLIEHWNGIAWKQVPSPSPGGTNGSALSGVDATSATSAWAVGTSGVKTLILHWNGTAWTKVASPNPSPFANELSGVAATSAADIWAVGIRSVVENFLTLAVHCC